MTNTAGLQSVSTIEYENVAIAEGFSGSKRTGVTVTFVTEKCQDQPVEQAPTNAPCFTKVSSRDTGLTRKV